MKVLTLQTLLALYERTSPEDKAATPASETNYLEDLGLAHRTVSSQTWHYAKLTDKGQAIVEAILTFADAHATSKDY